MKPLVLPSLSAAPARILRSGLRFHAEPGTTIKARDPLASCYLRLSSADPAMLPLVEEQNDLQVVLATSADCDFRPRADASKGGYRDLVESGEWRAGEAVADTGRALDSGELHALVLAGRRGFESGEGRGSLLSGWHERVRGFWSGGDTGARHGTVLSLGTCEQNAIFRGEDAAFLSWFARAPGPAQLIAVSDERCVHSSAVLLQHLRRTPSEALAITQAVQAWMSERMSDCGLDGFPGFDPAQAGAMRRGRWPPAQEISFAFHLLAEAVGSCPILEPTEVLTAQGVRVVAPPDVIALTLGSELAHHYRHKRTGWVIALHSFRFGLFIGEAVMDWLRRDFEPVTRDVSDMQRDLAALADEVHARTGGTLMVQNLIASSVNERVANYAWLGSEADRSIAIVGNEANLMLADLTRDHAVAMIDSDAIAVNVGVSEVPDRFHASGRLVEAQRSEVHRVLRTLGLPGF